MCALQVARPSVAPAQSEYATFEYSCMVAVEEMGFQDTCDDAHDHTIEPSLPRAF